MQYLGMKVLDPLFGVCIFLKDQSEKKKLKEITLTRYKNSPGPPSSAN